MLHLELSDEQTAALLRELDRIIENDRYPLSPRIRTLKEIRALIKPYPVRRVVVATDKAIRAAVEGPIPETPLRPSRRRDVSNPMTLVENQVVVMRGAAVLWYWLPPASSFPHFGHSFIGNADGEEIRPSFAMIIRALRSPACKGNL